MAVTEDGGVHPATLLLLFPLFTPPFAKLLPKNLLHFFRSGTSQISVEAFLHRTSLMARVSTLGPSVAPCPVEASTVHGDTLLRIESLSKSAIQIFILSASDSESSQPLKMLALPATKNLSPIFDSLQSSRRTTLAIQTCKRNLGFSLVGCVLTMGPFLKFWPIFIKLSLNGLSPRQHHQTSSPSHPSMFNLAHVCDLTLSSKTLRSDFLLLCSQLLDWFSRSYELNELGQHSSTKSLTLVWYCGHLSRILSANFSRLWSEELYVTKGIISSVPTSIHMEWDHYYRVKFLECYMPACSFSDSMKKPSPISSVLERTLLPSHPWFPSIKVRNHPILLAASTWFVPATIEAKDLFSTSQILLKVTICNLPESFEEVSLTHQELACGMLLCSLCFRVSLDLSSKFDVYPIFRSSYYVSLCLISLIVSNHVVDELVSFVPFWA